MSLAESILIIVDIDWNLGEVEIINPNLIDELTRVFHPIHRDLDSIEYSDSHHTVSVVGVREMYSGNKRGEYLASPECQSAEEWNIAIGFDYESGTQHHIESLIRFECLDEFVHISYIMLSISVKCHEIFPTILGSILSDILKSCLECRSGPTVGDMMDEVDSVSFYQILQKSLRPISRAIVDDEDLSIPRSKNPLDHAQDTSGFIVGSDEEYYFIFLHFVWRSRG